MQQPIERNEQMAFGGLMKFGQQMIHQASIAVDAFFQPFKGEESQKFLLQGAEDIPMGAVLFSKVERTAATVQARKKRRLIEHTRVMSSSTRRQPKVFCNVKFVDNYNQIVFAGIADGPDITIRNDDWRYRTGASVIPVISGTRTVMNTGPDDVYEGEWVYYEIPKLSIKSEGKGKPPTIPHTSFQNHTDFFCHRAVLRPVTKENYEADPDCIYRAIGKCVAFARAGQMLDLSISTAVAPVPFDAVAVAPPGRAVPLGGTAVVASASGPVASSSSGTSATAPGATGLRAITNLSTVPRMVFGSDAIGFTLMTDGKSFELYTEDGSQPLTGADVANLLTTPVTAETEGWTGNRMRITFDGTNIRIYDAAGKAFTSGGGRGHYGGRFGPPAARAYPTGPAPKRTLSGLRSGNGLTRPPAALANNVTATQRRNDLGPEEAEEDEDEEEEDEESEDGTETVTSSSSSTAQ